MSDIGFISFRPQAKPPPTQFRRSTDHGDLYMWYITKDEYLRLNKIFGRDFQECNTGGTLVVGLPSPCEGCGKYTEFIDWVWTALKRGVHSSDFMFEALKDSRMPKENMHDVYCSGCGLLTAARSRNNAEGGAPNISLAGILDRSNYPEPPAQTTNGPNNRVRIPKENGVMWGDWWLDDNGSVASWRAAQRSAT